jgi:hypothetical protein
MTISTVIPKPTSIRIAIAIASPIAIVIPAHLHLVVSRPIPRVVRPPHSSPAAELLDQVQRAQRDQNAHDRINHPVHFLGKLLVDALAVAVRNELMAGRALSALVPLRASHAVARTSAAVLQFVQVVAFSARSASGAVAAALAVVGAHGALVGVGGEVARLALFAAAVEVASGAARVATEALFLLKVEVVAATRTLF